MFIIKSIISDTRETSIIEAPTGSGKSFITLIAAGVLYTYYNLKSYILCSDLFLWNQYKQTIDKYNIKKFGYLKGSQGNYKCFVNNLDFKYGRCRLEKVPFHRMKDYKFLQANMYTCVYKCEYMQQRFRAEESPVTLMTYQLWLHYMNLVKTENPPFQKRDIIFCDECHNIPNIVQQFCQPIISPLYDINMIKAILKYAEETNIEVDTNIDDKYKNENGLLSGFGNNYSDVYDTKKILNEFNNIYQQLGNEFDNYEKSLHILNNYFRLLKDISQISNKISEAITTESSVNAGKLSKSSIQINSKIQWIDNYINSLDNFITSINKAGKEYLLIEYNKDNTTGEYSYTLNCAKEDYLCHQYLLKNSIYKVMLSATVGGHSSFDENLGIKYTNDTCSYMSKIPSTFNFDKSPIYYIPKYKMNYANKAKDFNNIINIVLKIVQAHKNMKGIIHTGSYENAKTILQTAPNDVKSRFYVYANAKQKDEVMEKFKKTGNGILIGPTLTEGVDLPDDLCRFIIIVKVPYPNITSKLVKKKIDLFPLWYNSTTSNIIIQSIGRGVRNENDYCTTYILDGCFTYLYEQTKDQYPDYIQNRIKIIQS